MHTALNYFRAFAALATLGCVFLVAAPAFGDVRELAPDGPGPTVTNAKGNKVVLYAASYALLIGESKYLGPSKHGWPPLDNTAQELIPLAAVLQHQGFHVTSATDVPSVELSQLLRHFIVTVGNQQNNRIVVVFSGHGYTSANGTGYLVPVDAPDADSDPTGMLQKLIPLQTMTDLAREGSAKHMLFVLDSCFSGSIFMTKSLPTVPSFSKMNSSTRLAYFLGAAQQPVRQFIAAGRAGEKLPAVSVFVPFVVRALQGGLPISTDGYITGKEMGAFIEQNLPSINDRTHPHSGTIDDPNLDWGDIIFQPPASPRVNVTSPQISPTLPLPLASAGPRVAIPSSDSRSGLKERAPSSSDVNTDGHKATSMGMMPLSRLNQPFRAAISDEHRTSYMSDVLFGSGSAQLSDHAKHKIDELIAQMQNLSILEKIEATGFCDRLEADSEQSQVLSERRAQAVKRYLIAKGAPPDRVIVEGRGSRNPVTTFAQTSDAMAPDRRVELEVYGLSPDNPIVSSPVNGPFPVPPPPRFALNWYCAAEWPLDESVTYAWSTIR